MSSNEVANQIVNILDLLGGEAGLTSIPTLREVIGAPQKTFDDALFDIYKELTLHHHDAPSQMSPRQRKEAFYDPSEKRYYVGIHLANQGKRRERNLDLVADIIREVMTVLGPERGVIPLPALKDLMTPVSKKVFDAAVRTLKDEGVVELDKIYDPEAIDEDGLSQLVDGKYIGISKT